MQRDILSTLWVEKYRPKDLDDVVIDDTTRDALKGFIETANPPHCMFVGAPGTGKTTIARIFQDKLMRSDSDFIFMNASDNRGIADMKNIVLEFMKTPPIRSKIKLAILDESDNLTRDAWMVLRNPIENPEYNPEQITRFIFTANYEHKIPDFMLSRCSTFRFAFPPRAYALAKSKEILSAEQVEYDEETLIMLVDALYPDLRKIINSLQSSSGSGKLIFANQISFFKDVLEKTKSFYVLVSKGKYDQAMPYIGELREAVRTVDVNPYQIAKCILDEMELPSTSYIMTNNYMQSFNRVLDKNHHFISMLYDVLLAHRRLGC